MKNTSNITNKSFKLLNPAVGTIKVRRELASSGIPNAQKEVTMAPELLNPFADVEEKQEVLDDPSRKLKLETDIEVIVGCVKKLCVEPKP